MPGLIDPHVHLRDPGFPQKETIATGLARGGSRWIYRGRRDGQHSPVNDSPEVTRYMLELRASRSCGAADAGLGA